MSAHPANIWSLSEFFPGAPEVIDTVFETAHGDPLPNKDRPSSRFEVACGFHGNRSWCGITEALWSWDDIGSDELDSAFKEKQALRGEAFDNPTDRAVRRSTPMPGTIIAARIRQQSTAQAHELAQLEHPAVQRRFGFGGTGLGST